LVVRKLLLCVRLYWFHVHCDKSSGNFLTHSCGECSFVFCLCLFVYVMSTTSMSWVERGIQPFFLCKVYFLECFTHLSEAWGITLARIRVRVLSPWLYRIGQINCEEVLRIQRSFPCLLSVLTVIHMNFISWVILVIILKTCYLNTVQDCTTIYSRKNCSIVLI